MTYIVIFRYDGGAPPQDLREEGDGKPSISFFVECRSEQEYEERKKNLQPGGYIVWELYGAEDSDDGIPRKWRVKENYTPPEPKPQKGTKRKHLGHLRKHKP